MAALFCLVINIMLIIINFAIYKDKLAPPIVLNILWSMVHALNYLLGWNSNEFVYLILALPSLMFNVGFCFSTGFILHDRKTVIRSDQQEAGYHINRTGETLLFIMAVIFATVYIGFFISRISTYYESNFWYTLRLISWGENTKEISFLTYPSIPVFLLPSVYLFYMKYDKRKGVRVRFFIILIIALIWSYFTTSRTATFTIIVIAAVSQITYYNTTKANKKQKRRLRFWLTVSAIGFVIMFVYISVIKSGIQADNVPISTLVFGSIANYTNLSSACFVEWFQNGFTYKMGQISFRFIFAVLKALGMNIEVLNTTSGGIYITYGGYVSNAFTVARNYIEDFGVLYMAGMLGVFGTIHGFVYKKAKIETGVKKIRFLLLNAMLFIPLIYQIMTDQYLNVFSGWIQYTLWICFMTSHFFIQKPYKNQTHVI